MSVKELSKLYSGNCVLFIASNAYVCVNGDLKDVPCTSEMRVHKIVPGYFLTDFDDCRFLVVVADWFHKESD